MKKYNEKGERLFNIDILSPSKNDVKFLGEIVKLNIYSSGHEFEPEGLFSADIFGPVGSRERNRVFGYIDLGVSLLHPLIYQHITSLNGFYKDIIHGKVKAVFDKDVKDFVPLEDDGLGIGGSGLHYFLKHASELDLSNEKGSSDQRDFKIDMFERYHNKTIQYLLVLPAGLRDHIVKDGKPSEDEVNDKYRGMLSMANNIKAMGLKDEDMEMYNPMLITLQELFLDIYLHFKNILEGKTGAILSMWAKRAVMHGTRNVITPVTKLVEDIRSENKIGFNDTVVGLYQYMNAINPLAKHRMNLVFLNRILNPDNSITRLFDKDGNTVPIKIKPKTMRKWTTFEGLDKILNSLGQDEKRYQPIKIEDHYPLMVKDSKDKIEIFFPGEETVKGCRPITYMEFAYLAIYDIRNKYPAEVTRYPVTGIGSTYLTNLYIKTTVNDRTVELTMDGVTKTIYNYPILNENPYNSMSPHYTRLEALGADHDGDTMSLNVLFLDESLEDRDKLFKDLKYYISPDNTLTFSADIPPDKILMLHLTEDAGKYETE